MIEMAEEKLVPHMTDLVTILRSEKNLRTLLETVRDRELSKDDIAEVLMGLPGIDLKPASAKRYIGSLCTYSFLVDDKTVGLSDYSRKYLENGEEFPYPDYILSCLSRNLEWSYFLPDLHGIVEEHGPLKKSDIISHLGDSGYDVTSKVNVGRYLGEILPILDIAEVIRYESNLASSGKRSRNNVLRYARTNQRELLNMLQMANRRVIPKPTLRRIYRATVKAHLPLRRWRTVTSNAQEELEEIRAIDITKREKEKERRIQSKWELTDDLWGWQKEFLRLWLQKKRGIAKVVTGAGKTHLALAIIEKLKKQSDDLHVTIIVPTIVLLEQWYSVLMEKLQISPDEIGLKGGGYSDTFEGNKILIVVINSAIKGGFIMKETEDLENNLLIVDECHRAGAKEFRRIFKATRDWELGLSATPEREMDRAFEEVLEKELGSIIGEYTYNDALEDGIIPRFDIYNYAVILNEQEKNRYSRLTKEIRKIVERLKYKYQQLNNPKIKMEAMLKALQKDHPEDKDLFLYFQKTKERKNEVLYPAESRKRFVRNILDRILEKKDNTDTEIEGSTIVTSPQDRVIMFHEIIDEVNSLFIELDSPYVSIYHSGFPNSLNRIGLDLYQSGQTRVLLSVRALIEGVDVPKTNLGIIMASSSSQTQRIQSLGRVLRKAKGKEETKLFIVYVRNTTDERIYRKTNWDRIIGRGNIEFRMWTEFGDIPIDAPQAPERRTYVDIEDINEESLEEDGIYPGKYEGESYSFDSYGKLFKKIGGERSYVGDDDGRLWQRFKKHKPSGGKLIINERGHVLIKTQKKGRLETVYIGTVDDRKRLS